MKVRLLKDTRVTVKAGEIVEVSPVDFNNLVTLGAAEPVVDKKKKAKKG